MTATTNFTNRLDYEFDLSKVQQKIAEHWDDGKIKSDATGTTTGSAEDEIAAKLVGAPATSKTSLSAGEQEIARLVGAAETTVTDTDSLSHRLGTEAAGWYYGSSVKVDFDDSVAKADGTTFESKATLKASGQYSGWYTGSAAKDGTEATVAQGGTYYFGNSGTLTTDSLTKKYAINYAVADGTVNGAKADSTKMVEASSTTVSNKLSDNISETVKLTGGSSSSTTYYYSTTFDANELMAETVSWAQCNNDFAGVTDMTGKTAIDIPTLCTADISADIFACNLT